MLRLASLAALLVSSSLLVAQEAQPQRPFPGATYTRPADGDTPPARSAEDMRQMRQSIREEVERRRSMRGAVQAAAVAPQGDPQAAEPVQESPAPESSPANPPQVQYSNGLLTITALNSSLEDILSQVRAQTGAVIETPAGAPHERVVVKLGPAPATQVLGDLLHGSRFDYIILGSAQQPGAIEHVILTLRGPPPTSGPVVHPRSAFVPPDPGPDDALGDEGMGDVAPPPPPTEEPTPAPAPGQPYSPGRPIGGEPPVRTPEELLKELQRLQQEQQQQQQQQDQRPRPDDNEPDL